MCVACVTLRKPKIAQTEEKFRQGFVTLLSEAPPGIVLSSANFSIPASQPPWFDTGIELKAGERITLFVNGQAILSRELDLAFHPDMQLWYRIGEAGEIFRGTRSSHTFTADGAGRLFLGNYFPGEWSTRTGAVSVGADSYRAMEGSLGVHVIRWACEPLDGLGKPDSWRNLYIAPRHKRASHPGLWRSSYRGRRRPRRYHPDSWRSLYTSRRHKRASHPGLWRSSYNPHRTRQTGHQSS